MRFTSVVGQTPLEYLTQWRMLSATRLIEQHDMPLAEVSHQVGYESVAAFNRMFKRATGMTPGAFRKQASRERTPAGEPARRGPSLEVLT